MLSLVWLFKPPNFMKPRWLREVESGAAPEPATGVYGASSAIGARRIYIPPVVCWGLWIATAVIFSLFLALDWSPSVLVGLGAGVSLLAAHTPKKAYREESKIAVLDECLTENSDRTSRKS
jgi:hypothetical protein